MTRDYRQDLARMKPRRLPAVDKWESEKLQARRDVVTGFLKALAFAAVVAMALKMAGAL